MIAAIVGFAGLKPTLKAVEKGKTIALANKETLVVAGDIVMQKALENKSPIIPVDSEHSAIFQCLIGEGRNPMERIILTASGGAFRDRSRHQFHPLFQADPPDAGVPLLPWRSRDVDGLVGERQGQGPDRREIGRAHV